MASGPSTRCAAATGHASKDRPRIFVEVSGAVLPKPREGHWRELATEAELHALSDGGHPPNTEAVMRGARGGPLVSMQFQTRRRRAHVVDYCFRTAGPLARVRGTFNSYLAVSGGSGIRRRRTVYYDAQGGVLQTKTGVFDLATDEPLPKVQVLDEEDPVYRSLRGLPFADELLPPVAAVNPDPSGLSAAVRERLPAVKACYQRAQRGSQRLAGSAVGHWTIDEHGKVAGFSWQSDEIKSASFSACARKVIESRQFPTRDAPAVVSFPFVFEGPSEDVSFATFGRDP